jgi:hypothetical protein
MLDVQTSKYTEDEYCQRNVTGALKYCPITGALATLGTTSHARLDSTRHHCIVADRWDLSCHTRDRCSVLL